MKKLTALLLLLPVIASADPKAWMKKENPSELYVFASVEEPCPFSADEFDNVVKGVLVRSRIKPSSIWEPSVITLSVTLNCHTYSSDMYLYDTDVKFAKISLYDTETYIQQTLVIGDDYGWFGLMGKQSITDALRTSVEAAITDYLKANFDLGD